MYDIAFMTTMTFVKTIYPKYSSIKMSILRNQSFILHGEYGVLDLQPPVQLVVQQFFHLHILGLLVENKMYLVRGWKVVIDKFHNSLFKQKVNVFSIGVSLNLLKFKLGSLGIYYISMFKLPRGVIQLLDLVKNQFLGKLTHRKEVELGELGCDS